MKKLPLFPAMTCVPSCTECCGLIPCTEAEYKKVAHVVRAKGIIPRAQGLTCPLAQEGKCTVYDARPNICRVFGHSERLVCPEGRNANGDEKAIQQFVMKGGLPTRLLHELLVDAGTITDIKTYLDQATAEADK